MPKCRVQAIGASLAGAGNGICGSPRLARTSRQPSLREENHAWHTAAIAGRAGSGFSALCSGREGGALGLRQRSSCSGFRERRSARACVPPAAPLDAAVRGEREAELILDHLDAVWVAAGTSRENIVRLDQYYTSVAAIPPYQRARRRGLGSRAPREHVHGDEAPAAAACQYGGGRDRCHSRQRYQPREAPKPQIPAISGPSPTIVAGDLVFISGQLATADMGAPTRDGLAEEACVPATTFWGGDPIRVETEYVLKRRIAPALERAGSSACRRGEGAGLSHASRGHSGLQPGLGGILRRRHSRHHHRPGAASARSASRRRGWRST